MASRLVSICVFVRTQSFRFFALISNRRGQNCVCLSCSKIILSTRSNTAVQRKAADGTGSRAVRDSGESECTTHSLLDFQTMDRSKCRQKPTGREVPARFSIQSNPNRRRKVVFSRLENLKTEANARVSFLPAQIICPCQAHERAAFDAARPCSSTDKPAQRNSTHDTSMQVRRVRVQKVVFVCKTR